jgi:hypothetical protein
VWLQPGCCLQRRAAASWWIWWGKYKLSWSIRPCCCCSGDGVKLRALGSIYSVRRLERFIVCLTVVKLVFRQMPRVWTLKIKVLAWSHCQNGKRAAAWPAIPHPILHPNPRIHKGEGHQMGIRLGRFWCIWGGALLQYSNYLLGGKRFNKSGPLNFRRDKPN